MRSDCHQYTKTVHERSKDPRKRHELREVLGLFERDRNRDSLSQPMLLTRRWSGLLLVYVLQRLLRYEGREVFHLRDQLVDALDHVVLQPPAGTVRLCTHSGTVDWEVL
jgi:hypothetical protein